MDEYVGYFDQIAAMNAANNAWSAEQAQKQMDFQERMSSTAHQREVADLQAAGLNPILSARAAGASSPSGAMGSTDTSGPGAMVSLLGHLVQSMTAMENARLSAQASLAVAEKYNATSELIARLQTGNQMDMLLRQLEWNEEHPSSMWSTISSLIAGLNGGNGVQSSGSLIGQALRGVTGSNFKTLGDLYQDWLASKNSGKGYSHRSGNFNSRTR